MALASVLGIKVANEELGKKKMLVCAQSWFRLQAWTCGEWWMKKKYLPCIAAYFAVAAEALRFFLFYWYFFPFSIQDWAHMQKCTFWQTDVMASRQMKAQPCTHTHPLIQRQTHADTHITHPHTHTKVCFLFCETEHYCKLDLFTIITLSTSLPSVSCYPCLFLYWPVVLPLTPLSLSPPPTLSCFASFFLCFLVFFPFVSP